MKKEKYYMLVKSTNKSTNKSNLTLCYDYGYKFACKDTFFYIANKNYRNCTLYNITEAKTGMCLLECKTIKEGVEKLPFYYGVIHNNEDMEATYQKYSKIFSELVSKVNAGLLTATNWND